MRTEVEDMTSSGSTVISATDVLAAYNGHKRRGRPRFFFWLASACGIARVAGRAPIKGGLPAFPRLAHPIS